jgi:hypothetical protein
MRLATFTFAGAGLVLLSVLPALSQSPNERARCLSIADVDQRVDCLENMGGSTQAPPSPIQPAPLQEDRALDCRNPQDAVLCRKAERDYESHGGRPLPPTEAYRPPGAQAPPPVAPAKTQVLNPGPSPEKIRSYMMSLPPKLRDQMVQEELIKSDLCVKRTIHTYATYNFPMKSIAVLVQTCVAVLGTKFYGTGKTRREYNDTVRAIVKNALALEFNLSVDEVERRFSGIGLWPLPYEDANCRRVPCKN